MDFCGIDAELLDVVYARKRKFADDNRKDDVLEICEYLLSRKLKSLCNILGAEVHPKATAKILHQMGQVYCQRSPDKNALIKSAILLNAALERQPENMSEIEKDLDALCLHVLQLSGATNTDVRLRDKANLLEKTVKEFRKTVKEEISIIEVTLQCDYEEKESQVKRITAIEKLHQSIYDWYCKVMKRVMDDCVSTMGNVPCKYALVGMGSLARKEATPYSDFEHIILLEEGVQERADYNEILEYFRWVSVIFHIIVVNIGETIVPCAALPYLNNSGNKTYNWFVDSKTKRGISFDEMFPHASKLPLGRPNGSGKPWKTELIKPVSEMLKYLSSDEDLKNGYHLSDILTVTCYVSGNQNIFTEFQSRVIKRKISKQSFQKQLEEDVENFNPITNISNISRKKKWNMKRVVYRSTTLFITALGRYYAICGNGSFDLIRKLTAEKVVEEDFAHDLSYAVAVALHTRLFTYLLNDRQEDWLDSPNKLNEFSLQFTQIMGMETPVLYFQTAMRLQRKTCEAVGLFDNNFVQWSPRLDRVLSCFWLQLNDSASWEAKEILSDRSSSIEDVKTANEVLLAIGSIYFEEGSFKNALSCFQTVHSSLVMFGSQSCEDDNAHCLHFIARCFYRLKNFKESLKHYRLELDMRRQQEQSENNDAQSGTCQQNIATSLQKVTRNLFQAEKYDEALEYYEEAIRIQEESCENNERQELLAKYCRNACDCLIKMKDFSNAKVHFDRAQTIVDTKGDSSLRENPALSANRFGDFLLEEEVFDEALKYYKTAIKIQEESCENKETDESLAKFCLNSSVCLILLEDFSNARVYFHRAQTIVETHGDPSQRKDLAKRANQLGNFFVEEQVYDEALMYYEEAIKIQEESCENKETNKTLAQYYGNAGGCLIKMEKYSNARVYFDRFQTIVETDGDSTLKEDSALSAKRFGNFLLRNQAYNEALKYYEEAIKIQEESCENKETDKTLAQYCCDACTCHIKMKEFSTAKLYFDRAKTIAETNGDPKLKEDPAFSSSRFGNFLLVNQFYDEALKYYEEAIKIREDNCEDKETDRTLAKYCRGASSCLINMKDFSNAKVYFDRSERIGKINGNPLRRKDPALSSNCFGEFLLGKQVYDIALKYYEEAIRIQEESCKNKETDKTLAQYCRDASGCLIKMKEFSNAKVYFDRAQTIVETNGDRLLRKDFARRSNRCGEFLLERQVYDEALKYYEEAIKIQEESCENKETDKTLAQYCRGASGCLIKMKEFSNAKVYFDRAQTIVKTNGGQSQREDPAMKAQRFGNFLLEKQTFDEALKYYEKAIKIQEESCENKETDEILSKYCRDASGCLVKMKDFSTAKVYFDRAQTIVETDGGQLLREDPVSKAQRFANFLLEKQTFDEALKYYEKAIKIQEDSCENKETDKSLAMCCRNACDCLIKMKELSTAKVYFDRAKTIVETNGDLSLRKNLARHANLFGKFLWKEQVYDEALKYYEEATKIQEQSCENKETVRKLVQYCGDACDCLFKLKEFSTAKVYFDKAKALVETNEDLFLRKNLADRAYRLGDSLFEKEVYDEALKYYEQAIKIQEESYKNKETDRRLARYCRSACNCLIKMNEFDNAKAYFDRAQTIGKTIRDPSLREDPALSANRFGEFLKAKQVHDEALKYYEEAIKIQEQSCESKETDKTLAEYYLVASGCLIEMEEFSKAKVYFDRAKTIVETNGDPFLRKNLAMCAKRFGNFLLIKQVYVESLKYYKAAIKFQEESCENKETDKSLAKYFGKACGCLIKMKEYSNAKAYFERAKTIVKTNGDPSLRKDQAMRTNWFGNFLWKEQAYDEALKYYEEAIKIQEESLEGKKTDRNLAKYCRDACDCLIKMKEFSTAKVYFDRAQNIVEADGDPSLREDPALSANRFGEFLLERQVCHEALKYYEEAIKIQEGSCVNKETDEALAKYCRDACGCLIKTKDIYNAKLYLGIAKTIVEASRDRSLKEDLTLSANRFGDFLLEEQVLDEALKYYEEAL